MNYACSRLFGVKCGAYCLSYVRTAIVPAALVIIPVALTGSCFTANSDCADVFAYVTGGLMLLGFIASLFLNPKQLVQEDKDQFQRPMEQHTFVNTHSLIEF